MVEIPLTRGKVALVDDCDAHPAFYKWQTNGQGYAVRMFRRPDGVRRTMFLHHEVKNLGEEIVWR